MVALNIAWINEAKSAPDSAAAGKNTRGRPPLNSAQSEFAKRNWPAAITYYRRHLKLAPNDYLSWGKLAVSYYNSGQTKFAFETFQRIEKLTPEKSMNYFYQGMCVASLGSEQDARKYWEYATNWTDEYGARSAFELALSTYQDGDIERSKQWLMFYIQKYPRGPDAQSAKDFLKNLNDGKKIDSPKGFERPDQEASIYRYHPWSLFDYPHFWEIQTGVNNTETTGYQPGALEPGTRYGPLEERAEQKSDFLVSTSIGVGPIRKESNTSFAGYSYRQAWLVQPESVQAWFTEGFAMDNFPLRGDLLERTHVFFGDIRRQFTPNLYGGAYSRLSYSRIGSSFFPSPDDSSLRVVTSDVDTQLLIPWMGWSWNSTNRSMFSLYLRKEIHNQSLEHSNKTFELSFSGSPKLSFTLSHSINFPPKQIEVTFDLFQYNFIFNDYWLDYKRTGALAAVDYTIWKGIGASLILGYYKDSYNLPHIRTGNCEGTDQSDNPKPVVCDRNDTGTMTQITVYYEKSQNLRLDLSYLMVENGSDLKVYSDSKNTLLGSVTWAFPGTRRVSKMTRRFSDAAFTKDTED
jgi:Tfp pilus assembly protein PilF